MTGQGSTAMWPHDGATSGLWAPRVPEASAGAITHRDFIRGEAEIAESHGDFECAAALRREIADRSATYLDRSIFVF